MHILMQLIDCHAHINSEDFDKDRDAVLLAAENSGVIAILDSGTNLQENKKVLALAKQFKILKPCLGWQPEQINSEAAKENLDFIKSAIGTNEVVAIGEVGLDFWRAKLDAEKEKQKEIFKIYINLAKELNLPIVTHSRSAGKYVIEILEKEKAERVCMHAFDGKFGSAQKGVELGYYFSIPPSIIRSNQKQNLVKNLPLENLLLESDAPALDPNLKERNTPVNIKIAAQKIAEIKKIDANEVIKITTKNAKVLFRL